MPFTREVIIRATTEEIAQAFCDLDDDAMCKFFVEVARRFSEWGPGKGDMQLWYVGGHMRTCECSTEQAREWVRELARCLEISTHT